MAFGRKTADPPVEPPVASPRSLIASAVQVQAGDVLSWRMYSLGRDEAWQRELWRLYDLIGEFRFASNWIGSACSRVRIYVAEVDENGVIGPETKDPEVAALADTMLGGPASKGELLRLMGINLTVAGEFYIVGKAGQSGSGPKNTQDQWYVTTPAQLKRWKGGVTYNGPDGPMTLMDNLDMIIRVWTPHPARTWLADSPARGAMQILVEIERLTRFVFSQIDSRLFSAGILPIPTDMDLPKSDTTTGPADSLMQKIAEAGMASLKGEGSAAGLVPIIMEVPPESLGKIDLIKLDSPLSEQALELRKEAIQRFAYSMDFPPEIMTGQGASNHWSAWYIDENASKVHIEPIMNRICDALTQAYLAGALKKLGKDPDRFTYWFDTAGLTLRPTRLQDAINLYKENILGSDAVLEAGYFRQDQKMSADESALIFGRQVAIQDPTQLQSEDFREMVGITAEMMPNGPVTPPPPPPIGHAQDADVQPLPERSATPPGQEPAKPNQQRGIQAGAYAAETLAIASLANLTVLRALELAGGRLTDRSGRFSSTPKHERHTLVRTSADQVDRLLAGAWTYVPAWTEQVGVDTDTVTAVLEGYTTQLLRASQPHDPNILVERLRREGLIDE